MNSIGSRRVNGQVFLYFIAQVSYTVCMDDFNQTLADWIRGARKAAGYSQDELGAKLALELAEERGYTKANISHWETRKHSPSLKQLIAISKVTGCSLPPDLVSATTGGHSDSPAARLFTAARELAGFDCRKDVADALGQPEEAVASWEGTGILPKLSAIKAQSIWGCSATWILTGEGSMRRSGAAETSAPARPSLSLRELRVVASESPATVSIQRVPIRLRAGITGVESGAGPEDGGIFEVPVDVVTALGVEPQWLFATRAKGSSMEPMIFDSELAVFNRKAVELKNGAIYALNFNGEGMIKQLVHRGSEWYLHSFNSEFPDVNVRSGECQVVGMLAWQPPRLVTHQFG